MINNSVKDFREAQLISKNELAKMADLSSETITRVEKGFPCRIQTKRKIMIALGLNFSDVNKVFGKES